MARSLYMDLLNDPPLANQTAVVATVETALWVAGQFSPINANDARTGKTYRVTAGGIMSFAATGNLIITPRWGLTVGAGVSLGPNPVAVTTPGVTTNAPWLLDFVCVVRSVGAAGLNSSVVGVGTFISDGIGTLGTGVVLAMGGLVATVDVSIPTGLTFGWTLSVAGSITPQFAFIQAIN